MDTIGAREGLSDMTIYCALGCLRIVQQPGDLCMFCLSEATGYPLPEPEEPK